MVPPRRQPCETPTRTLSGMPASANASANVMPLGSTPTPSFSGNSPASYTFLTISANSATSSPIRLTMTRSLSCSKSRKRGAISFLRSNTDGCAQARPQCNQRPVPGSRPTNPSPNKSSRPPPSIPPVMTSTRSRKSSRWRRLGSPCACQWSAPAQRSDRRFRPISTLRCFARNCWNAPSVLARSSLS
ncbi:hypothetical protein D3C72_1502240 [compost metagenome]